MMTKEDIIRMAHEAGLHLATDLNWMSIIDLKYAEKFAELVLRCVMRSQTSHRTWCWVWHWIVLLPYEQGERNDFGKRDRR